MVLAGFMTHMCVSSTARAALDLGFRTTIDAEQLRHPRPARRHAAARSPQNSSTTSRSPNYPTASRSSPAATPSPERHRHA
jgi:nicotinamidase-related amidase